MLKAAKLALDRKVIFRYGILNVPDVQTLVIENKWFTIIHADIISEVQRLTQAVVERVKELEERYAKPLIDLEDEVEDFSLKVDEHLLKMGVA